MRIKNESMRRRIRRMRKKRSSEFFRAKNNIKASNQSVAIK